MSTDPDVHTRRLIERLWSIGYTEATLRRQSLLGRLDALTEATVWICDLLADRDPHRYSLSHVEVRCNGNKLASTLADFDTDLPALFRNAGMRPCQQFSQPAPLTIHAPLDPTGKAARLLDHLWREAVAELRILDDLSQQPAMVHHELRPWAPQADADIQKEFHANLRSAFSAMFESISGTPPLFHSGVPFTLQVRWGGHSQMVRPGHTVDFALGYCLPSHTRYYLLQHTELTTEDLHQLEPIFAEKEAYIRTQSHSFIESRLSGHIHNHRVRPRDTMHFPKAPKFREVAKIEAEMWRNLSGGKIDDYPHLFMMPLVEYSSMPQRPLSLAHSYLQTKPIGSTPSLLLPMVQARYRVTALFFETLHRLCCDAVAREIAQAVMMRRDPQARLPMIAHLYGKPPTRLVFGDLASRGDARPAVATSLYDKLTGAHLREFGTDTFDLPPHIADWLQTRDLHSPNEREEFDILLRLRERLAALVNERARATLVEELHGRLAEVVRTVTTVKQHMMRHRQTGNWQLDVLHGFRILYDNNRAPCLCQLDRATPNPEHNLKSLPDYPSRRFLDIHGVYRCCAKEQRQDLDAEVDRRLAHLFGAPLECLTEHADAPLEVDWDKAGYVRERCDRFFAFCRRLGGSDARVTAFEWIKRAAGCSPRTPSMAAVVVMLYMLHPDLVVEPRDDLAERDGAKPLGGWDPTRSVANPPDDWPLSLAGIAGLAAPERPGEESAPLVVEMRDDDLRFRVGNVAVHNHYDEIRKKAADGSPGSRVTQMRYAYGQPHGPIRHMSEIGSVSVELESSANGLVVSWLNALQGN